MPGFDQTGPRGDGPMSGKAQGMWRVAGTGGAQERYGGCGQGRSRGRGRGFGCGMGNRFGRRGVVGLRWTEPLENEVKD